MTSNRQWSPPTAIAAFAFAGILAGCGQSAAPNSANTGPPPEVTVPAIPGNVASAISEPDANAISQFQTEHGNDPRFGAIWVDYGAATYSVHVRYLDPTFQTALGSLRDQVSVDVIEHTGGANYLTLQDLTARVHAAAPTAAFNVNTQDGVLELYDATINEVPADILSAEFVSVVPTPSDPPGVGENAAAGEVGATVGH